MRISRRRRHPGEVGHGSGEKVSGRDRRFRGRALNGPVVEVRQGCKKKGLDLAPALTTSLTANCRLTLSLPLGTRLFVEAALPEFGVETRPLHLTLETAKGPLEAFVVLNGYFQKITTPLQE